jgi:hypothetical protein
VDSGRKQWLLNDKTLLNAELANDLHSLTTKGGTGNSEKTPDKDNLSGLFLSILFIKYVVKFILRLICFNYTLFYNIFRDYIRC